MKQQENIKNPSFAKASEGKQKLKIIQVVFVITIFAFLFLNLVFSQLISPIYFRFINNDKNATINLLQKIKTFPEFQKILEMNKNIYGKTVEEETFRQENNKKLMINNLEQQLIINPKARDILYSLYQLYLAEEDTVKAEEYLKRTREVDPVINPTNTTNPDQSDK